DPADGGIGGGDVSGVESCAGPLYAETEGRTRGGHDVGRGGRDDRTLGEADVGSHREGVGATVGRLEVGRDVAQLVVLDGHPGDEIGRASCRERAGRGGGGDGITDR